MLQEIEDGSRDAATGLSKLGDEAQDAGKQLDEISASSRISAFSDLANGMADIGSSMMDMVDSSKEYLSIMGQLEASSERMGYSAEQTQQTYQQLYGVLGDPQTAATATANLQALGMSQSDLTAITEGAIGAWAQYGDSIPIDSLAEAINETAQTGTVTGAFADVLNWAGTSEDEFNSKLQSTSDKSARAKMILQELTDQGLIKSADGFRENNDAIIAANEAQSEFESATADLAETIMPAFTEVMQIAAKAVQWLADLFKSLPGPVQEVISVIVVVIGIIAMLSPIISTITGIITAIGVASAASAPGIAASGAAAGTSAVGFGVLSASLLPIALIIAGIIAAIIAVIAVIKNWDKIVAWFKEHFSGAIETIKGIIEGFKEFFQNAWEFIKTIFETAWTAIWENPVVQIIVTTITSLFEGMKTTLQGIWNGIKDIASGAWELIKNTILAPVLLIIDLVTGDFDQLKSDAENIWNNIKSAAQTIWNGIKQVIMAPIEGLVTFVTSAFNGIKSTVSSIAQSIFDKIKEIPGIIKEGFQAAVDFFVNLPSRALTWGRDFIQGFINGITQKLRNLVDKIRGIGDTIRSFLHFSRPDEGPLRDYETWMPDFIKGLADGIYNNLGMIRSASAALSGSIRAGISERSGELTWSSSMPRSQTFIVEGDTMVLDGKIVGRTAERRITANQVSAGRAKGGRK